MSSVTAFRALALVLAGLLWTNATVYAQTIWYVDDDAPNDPGPGDPTVSDPDENGSAEHPFDAIQEAIDASTDDDLVTVATGLYHGEGNRNLDFGGRAITVRSEAGPETCVIECAGYERGFRFQTGEELSSVVDGFTISGDADGGGVGVSFTGSSPTISDCVITAFGDGGILCYCQSDPLIVRCEITENTSYRDGGGVCCDDQCSPTLVACTITRNSAGGWGDGGGVYCAYDCTPMIIGCEIAENTSYWDGGGVYCGSDSDLIIADSVIVRNVARGWMGGGGGVYGRGDSLTILDSIIRDNRANWYGGGIKSEADLSTITGCDISGNVAYTYGGGVDGWGMLTISDCTIDRNVTSWEGGGINWGGGDVTISRCTINGNRTGAGGGGGGVRCGGDARFTNCLVAGNVAGEYGGGGIYVENTMSLTNCTLTGNSAGGDGGGAIYCSEWGGNATLANCILWGDFPDEIDPAADVVATYSDIQGGWPRGEGNLDVDPEFAFVDDTHLMPGSPCVDTGTNHPPDGLPSNDLDGHSRNLDGDDDGNRAVDMGAYELDPDDPTIAYSPGTMEFVAYPGEVDAFEGALAIRGCGGHVSGDALSWYVEESCPWLAVDPSSGESEGEVDEVTISVDATGLSHGTYSCAPRIFANSADNSPRTVWITLHVASGYPAIQMLIDAAEDGDTVVVPDGTYTGPENRNLDFRGKAITLRSAGGPENCVIDCEHDGRGFIFQSGEGAESIVDGFTITNGVALNGGGVYCWDGDPTIRACVIVENTAAGAGGGVASSGSNSPTLIDCVITQNAGGGYYSRRSGSPTFVDCAITHNTGPGIYLGRYNHASIIRCTFEANTLSGYGSGVWCGERSHPLITDCTFEANEAREGGAVYCGMYAYPTISGCTIRSNTASSTGGGIAGDWDSSPTIHDCVIVANEARYGGGAIYFSKGEPTILNCLVSGNSAESGSGGGILCVRTTPTIANCEIAGNTAELGGGMYFSESSPFVTNCTIAGNTAEHGGGIRARFDSDLVIANCISWDNQASVSGDEISLGDPNYPASVTVHYSDVRGGDEAVYVEAGSSLVWGDGNIDADPLYVDPDGPDNDPDTWEDNDYHLSGESPCIDAADNDGVPAGVTADLDGRLRFADRIATPDSGNPGAPGPPIVDMGAYEYQCTGDLNGDGEIMISDLAILLAGYGTTGGAVYADGDIDQDGDVDPSDLAALLSVYGTMCQ